MWRWSNKLVVSGLLSTFLLFGCEPAGNPVGPTDGAGDAGLHGPSGSFSRLAIPSLSLSTATATSLIGADGGSLSLLGHTITVPAGAVAQPTLFVITQVPGYLEVDLTALVINIFGTHDVGSGGFANGKRVQLRMSYAGAAGSVDPDRLVVLRLLNGGGSEVLETTVDSVAQTATVDLEHFSRYCMAMD